MAHAYVSAEKRKRAEEIVTMLNRDPKDDSERELTEKYLALMNAAKVKADSEDALPFVYEKLLGGLLRTPQEQKVADEKKQAIAKKKRIEV